MKIDVKCHAGYRGEETPRVVIMGEREIGVSAVLDRWLAPDHRYFKIMGADRATYIIRHDVKRWRWELTFYKEEASP